VFAGLFFGAIPDVNGQEAKEAAAPAPGILRHSDLSVYRADDGTLKPIRTADDWAIRRKQILAGMQEATGPLPPRDKQPAFDIKITEDVRKYAAEQGLAAEEAIKKGLEEKSREFVEQGAEVYSKA
jgi:hypothetical protein